MIQIKDKVNKTQLFKELTEIGKKRFEFTCEPDEDLKVFLDGAETLFKLLRLPVVVKSLPNKEKLNFEDWLEFRKIDKLSDGAYRWEGSLYTEYYMKSIYETYLK